jgi:hypothetical protein
MFGHLRLAGGRLVPVNNGPFVKNPNEFLTKEKPILPSPFHMVNLVKVSRRDKIISTGSLAAEPSCVADCRVFGQFRASIPIPLDIHMTWNQ